MVREKYGVGLTPEQRDQLQHLIRAGISPGDHPGTDSAQRPMKDGPLPRWPLDVAEGTVFRIKRRFAEAGLEGVLKDRPQAHRYRKLDDRHRLGLLRTAERA